MTDWIYDGYTKELSESKHYYIERWVWKCKKCGYTTRRVFGYANKPECDCPNCDLASLQQPPQLNYSCSKCKFALKLVKYDYSNKGCEHTDMDGFCCMAMAHEGVATWMIGNDINKGFCECYQPKDSSKPEVTTFDGMAVEERQGAVW